MSDLLALATRARDAAQDSIQEHEKVGHNPAAGLQIPSKIIQIQVRGRHFASSDPDPTWT